MIQDIKKDYDCIIIDSMPSLGMLTIGAVITAGVFLVLKKNSSPKFPGNGMPSGMPSGMPGGEMPDNR